MASSSSSQCTVQSLQIRVLYTIVSKDSTQANSSGCILARHRAVPVSIFSSKTQECAETKFALAPLGACLDAMMASSPELLDSSRKDYSVYVLDPAEPVPTHLNHTSPANQPGGGGVSIGMGLMRGLVQETRQSTSAPVSVTGRIIEDRSSGQVVEVVIMLRESAVPRISPVSSLSFKTVHAPGTSIVPYCPPIPKPPKAPRGKSKANFMTPMQTKPSAEASSTPGTADQPIEIEDVIEPKVEPSEATLEILDLLEQVPDPIQRATLAHAIHERAKAALGTTGTSSYVTVGRASDEAVETLNPPPPRKPVTGTRADQIEKTKQKRIDMARAKQDEKKELLKVLYHPHLLHGMASNQIPPSSDPLLAPSSPTPAPRELRRSTSYYKPDTYAPPRNPSTMPLQSHKTAPTENSAPIHRPPPVTLTALKKKTPEQSKENIDPSPPKAKSSDKKKREREEGADHSAERASKKTRATLGQRNGPNASTPAVQVERPGTPPMPTAGPIVPRTPNDMPNVQPATPLPKTPLRKSASRASHCSPTPRGFQHLADPMSDLFSPMTPKQLGAYSAPAPFTPRTKATAEALNLGFDDVESWPSSQATTVAADSEPITAVPNTSNRWSDLPPSSPPPPSSPSPAPAPEEAQQSLNLFGFSDDDEINLEGFETYIPTDPQRGDDDVDYYSGLLSSDVDFSKINMEEVLRSLSDGMSGDSTAFEEGEEKVGGSASACVATKIQELYSGCVV